MFKNIQTRFSKNGHNCEGFLSLTFHPPVNSIMKSLHTNPVSSVQRPPEFQNSPSPISSIALIYNPVYTKLILSPNYPVPSSPSSAPPKLRSTHTPLEKKKKTPPRVRISPPNPQTHHGAQT
ncbi:hypothetical protein QAD02_009903 [Eretmocerus hayati]|uniref:Uncharacterized protein n=1 Tax=Eretmocerus hayati TaxID=131215 RepID=A0ACC2NAR7_9HYME|nr:hypothetical protein QAD02_009903 [Eretmocerus hayati]